MFARTERLLLRPGWIEDAPALARTIADHRQTADIHALPWPRHPEEAERHLAETLEAQRPLILIQRRTDDAPELIGGAAFREGADATVQLDLWIAPAYWNRGYGSEAGQAMLDMARFAAGLRALSAIIPTANRAAQRLYEKLGFAPVRQSVRPQDGRMLPALLYRRELDQKSGWEGRPLAA